MTDWDRVERLLGSDTLAQLATKKVAVIGLGSGGGFVAQSLAMSGVGHFVLVDDDTLDASNIVRHVSDKRQLGQPKVQAVADLIAQRNAKATCDVRAGKIEAHMDVFGAVDLVVVGVDQEQVKYVINDACRQHNVPAVYAGVYERGEGGDVVVIRPNIDNEPCYACWAAELRDGLAVSQLGAGEELDYGMIGESGTLEAEPGLWLHVVRVASAQADMALNLLLAGTTAHETMPANTVIMANRHMEILEGVVSQPYSAVWVDIKRDHECLVCGDAQRQRLEDNAENDDMSLDDLMGSVGLTLKDD